MIHGHDSHTDKFYGGNTLSLSSTLCKEGRSISYEEDLLERTDINRHTERTLNQGESYVSTIDQDDCMYLLRDASKPIFIE